MKTFCSLLATIALVLSCKLHFVCFAAFRLWRWSSAEASSSRL